MTNLCLSRGTEDSANSEWIPGGFTPTGNSEAVINAVEWNKVEQSVIMK